MNKFLICFFLVFACFVCKSQYQFTGNINLNQWENDVSLSLVEDYRKITNIYTEQIFCETQTDSLGNFVFIGNELETSNRIYRLHVDNCSEENKLKHQFTGSCNNSKYILFIAKNTDTTHFPFTFNDEMFCAVKSTNPIADALVKIDSLREEMIFSYGDFRSETNRKLNDKKWFTTFQNYGEKLNEPLAELYIYAFLSDKSSTHYTYYLQDLKTNSYYENLLNRLKNVYPKTSYTLQFEAELTSDKYLIKGTNEKNDVIFNFIIGFLILSFLLNVYLFWKLKKQSNGNIEKIKETLTQQEKKVIQLLVDDFSNKEIAQKLFVSLSTVKTHIHNIYKKLNVKSREEVKSLYNK